MTTAVTLYAMSNCEHCQHEKEYLEEHKIPFACINVDVLLGQERNDVMNLLKKYSMFPEVPTLVVGDKGVVGFKPEAIEGLLKEAGLMNA